MRTSTTGSVLRSPSVLGPGLSCFGSLVACFGALVACFLLSACGSGSSSSVSSGQSETSTQTSGAAALAADARSAATGDIPDNQSFLTYHNASPGFSIVYPEGWTVKQSGSEVIFKDKNNLVRIAIGRGSAPTPAAVQAQLATLKRSNPTILAGAP